MCVSLFQVIKLINRQSRRLHFLSLQTLQNFLDQNAHLLLLFFKAINILSSTQHDICHSLTYLHHIFKENKIFISAAASNNKTLHIDFKIFLYASRQTIHSQNKTQILSQYVCHSRKCVSIETISTI